MDSKKLNNSKKPCVIISASGMMEAGRVKHHLANSISNSKNTVLAVGYCSPNTLGAKLLRGEKRVSIFGTELEVKADIERIDAYSGHADYKEMIDFLSCQDNSKLQKVFIVHGQYEAQLAFKNTLEKEGYRNMEIPEVGQEYEIA
jgi:metallo-beta-lactamase family protein